MRLNRSVLIMLLAAAVVIPAALGNALACDKAKAAAAVAAADEGDATVKADCAGCESCTKAAALAKHAGAGCDKSKAKAAALLASDSDEGAGCAKAAALLAKAAGVGCDKTKCDKSKAKAAALQAKNEKGSDCPHAAAAVKEVVAEAEEQEKETKAEALVASDSGE
jgi:hypothetical protein